VLQLPVESTEYADNYFWVYGIVLRNPLALAHEFMNKLAESGIGTRPFFYPIHQQPVFHSAGLFRDVEAPVAEDLSKRGFYIPSGLALTGDQLSYVAAEVFANARS